MGMETFSVLVAGGGPAGCATAIDLAAKGLKVLLVERSRYERWRVGETLPPSVCVTLTQLGVWERFCQNGHLPSHAIHRMFTPDILT
jgi:2-polyprenyl-6-methoxyphenol hydroxylase-like FAD-dependent oxidoreductase